MHDGKLLGGSRPEWARAGETKPDTSFGQFRQSSSARVVLLNSLKKSYLRLTTHRSLQI